LEVWGAQGGGNGGKGGYAIGRKDITVSGNLYLCIGQQGGLYNGYIAGGAGGYNGGGKGGNSFNNSYLAGVGGGGATHIATTNRGTLVNYKNYKSELLIIAGGGGGDGVVGGNGGAGGGSIGGEGISHNGKYTINGATQTSGYAFGQGQDGYSKTAYGGNGAEGNSGGGGGYYGGLTLSKNGDNTNCGGSGGSGYVNTSQLTYTSMQSGVRSGNGYALITWMPVL
jgi:hypothetical protein